MARFVRNCWPACNADWPRLTAHEATADAVPASQLAMLPGSCWNHCPMDWTADGSVEVKNVTMVWPIEVTLPTVACQADERNDVNDAHHCCPTLV